MGQHRVLALQSASLLETVGGIEHYLDDLLSLVTEIEGSGSALALVPRRSSHSREFNASYPVVPVPFSWSGWLRKVENRFSPRFWKAARQSMEKLHPTFLLCGHVSLGPLCFLLSQRFRLPYVTVAYGIESWGNLLPQDELCLKQAFGILSISDWTRKVLVKRGYSPERIAVVRPALPVEFENAPPPKERKPSRPFTLLTISRLSAQEQYKGQDHVLLALAKLCSRRPELRVRYLIQGDGEDRARLQELARENGLSDRVEFRPGVKHRAQFSLAYQEADAYIMPSRFGRWDGRWRGEGFGIVYLEAAAHGVPSIAYDCGGATDFIRSGKNGLLVSPDDTDALATAIETLATQPAWAQELGRQARLDVLAGFTRAATRSQLEKALAAIPAVR